MYNQLNKFCLSIPRKLLNRLEITGLFLLVFLSSFIYSFINWQKHIHFQTFGWDTSVFDQQVYLASILKIPHSSLHTSFYNLPVGMNALGDHFHPLVLIIGGFLYRIWADPRMLFILQSVVVSLSAIPFYLLSKHVIQRTKIPAIGTISIGFALSSMYLFSVAFQAMVLDEFHDDVLVTLPLLYMLYFLVRKKYNLYWIAYIFVLLTKEEYGLLGIPIGLYIVITQKNVKHAILTAFIGITTFYLLLFHIMPSLAGNIEYPHFLSENKPSVVIQKMMQNPALFITKFFDHPAKIKTLKTSLFSYGALPLFSPTNLLLPASSLAIRFYDDTTPRRYEFNNHYASPFIPFFAVGSIFGLYNLMHVLIRKKWINLKTIWIPITAFLFCITAMQNLQLHGPINSLFKKSFYQTNNWEYDTYELIKRVPPNVTIASNNSLLAHLSQRESFYLLPEIGNAPYIAVDLHTGPNKHAPLSSDATRTLINALVEENSYQIVWQKNDALLLEKL